MSLTHFKGVSITPDPRGATALEVTGTVAFTGNPAITGNLAITGNPAVTGSLSVSGTTRTANLVATSNVSLGAAAKKLTFTGTTVQTVGNFTAKKQATVTGKLTAAATVVFSGVSGRQAVGASGIASVACTKVEATSRILLTPQANTANYKQVNAYVQTIAAGASFKINVQRTTTAGSAAAAAGTVSWFVISAA